MLDSVTNLPGARQEAQRVKAVLSAGGFLVEDCIDEKSDRIIDGLHRDAWRILHLAGHGEHDFPLMYGDQAKLMSGMVIGENRS